MSALTLTQTLTAVGPLITSSFQGVGGVPDYTYAVRPGGAGGSIDASTGVYTAPAQASSDPAKAYDTIVGTDLLNAIATAKILVGNPLLLFCDILQSEMGLADGRVYLWDQKIFQPTDDDLYIAVSMPTCKPFSNNIIPDAEEGWDNPIQYTNIAAILDIDAISRGSAARDRKEEIVLAFNSIYSQAQQEANSFYIGKLPPSARFTNLSMIDGAAIPYRYKISIALNYAVFKQKHVPYFDTFDEVSLAANP